MSKFLNRICLFILVLVGMLCMTSCADGKDSEGEEDYLVFWSDKEEVYSPMNSGEPLTMLGGQYYQGEPIQLWCKRIKAEEITLEVRLYRQDGSFEVILTGVPEQYFSRSGWFMTETGEFLVQIENGMAKLDRDGNEIARVSISDTIIDVCQLAGEKTVLLLQEAEGKMKLAEWDVSTGEYVKNDLMVLKDSREQYITASEEGLLLLDTEGIWTINLRNGSKECVMEFADFHFTFDMLLIDFRMTEEDKLEFLQVDAKVTLTVLNVTKERTIITLRAYTAGTYMEECAALFNRANDTYYILFEEYADGENVAGVVYMDEYRTKTSMELAIGEGPDIITGDIVNNINELLDKEMLVDLSPYMDRDGIKEENYFSAAFSTWKVGDKIYGVNMNGNSTGIYVDEEVLGGREVPELESLLDKLLAYRENVVFHNYWDAGTVLNYFLCGSENLWGMIDWEGGRCNFQTPLFHKMLQVADRYGKRQDNTYSAIANFRENSGYYRYDTDAWLESEGKVFLGYYFDDGCHMAMSEYATLGINANSKNPDGAWEFISFLLSDEIQSQMGWRSYAINKNAFDNIAAREMEIGSIESFVTDDGRKGQYFKGYMREGMDPLIKKNRTAYKELFDLRAETVMEIKNLLENTKTFPIKTKPILSIIQEETGAYFSGDKSAEEVISIIENRVQLYLEEHS